MKKHPYDFSEYEKIEREEKEDGKYYQLQDDYEKQMDILLDNEIASLFVPAENTHNAILKIRHLGGRELLLNRSVCPQGLEPSVYDYIIKHDLYRE